YGAMAGHWRDAGQETPDFDAFWERGYVELPEPERPFVLFEDFRQDPAAHPLQTPSGRIELYSERIASFGYDDCPPHPAWMPPAEWLGAPSAAQWPLHLLTPQPAGKLHGQLDAGKASTQLKINGREVLRIAPADAQARGIGQHDTVKVYNDR